MLRPLAAAVLAAALAAKAPASREAAFLVVLDPGHGGDQDGALAPDGVKEKDLTLQIAQRVGAALRRRASRWC